MLPHLSLPSLTVVLSDREAVLRAGRAAAAVAGCHDVVVLPRGVRPEGEDIGAAAAAARHEWVLLAPRGASPADLRALVPATAGHDLVLGRRATLAAPGRERRRSHDDVLAPAFSGRRRGVVRAAEFPLMLVRRDLAERLGEIAGAALPAEELAVLAVLLGEPAAIVRVDAPVPRTARRAPRAA